MIDFSTSLEMTKEDKLEMTINTTMKHFYLLPLALLLAACGNQAPDIDDLKEQSYPLVEQVLTEDDNAVVQHRLDRYILDGHPDKLTYTGTCKVTEFNVTKVEDGTELVDSTKYYRYVVINFRGTDYDKYTVNVYTDKE